MKFSFRPCMTFFAGAVLLASCGSDEPQVAVFSDFDYHVVMTDIDEVSSPDWTPLLPGCYPDPSIVKVGGDYYLVNSSFAFFPGIPIWHSTDLQNWDRLGFVLDRPSQLSIPDSMRISAGIYAPDISYNPANETFYVISTLIGNGGTFYVTSKDPQEGEWSDPVWLPEVGGIDPSILFDRDGKAYIVNNDAPQGSPLYDGHRAIYVHDFDWEEGRVTGSPTLLVDGGVDISQQPVWIEGPHLYHIGNRYFLMCAEGGTGPDHREVIFESSSPKGPFKPCPVNPILTQKDLDPSRPDPVTCTGHADLVEGPDGKWWAVFLGVRPYSPDGHDIMGRETFIHPVRWKGGRPLIAAPAEVLVGRPQRERENRLWDDTGLVSDAFFIRNPQPDFWHVDVDDLLLVEATPVTLSDRRSPSAIGRWVTENAFELSVTVDEFTPATPADVAGLMLFQDDDCWITFGKSVNAEGRPVVRVDARSRDGFADSFSAPLDDVASPVSICITADGKGLYTFSYYENAATSGMQSSSEIAPVPVEAYTRLPKTLPASLLSTRTAGNFTGTVMGVYATAK